MKREREIDTNREKEKESDRKERNGQMICHILPLVSFRSHFSPTGYHLHHIFPWQIFKTKITSTKLFRLRIFLLYLVRHEIRYYYELQIGMLSSFNLCFPCILWNVRKGAWMPFGRGGGAYCRDCEDVFYWEAKRPKLHWVQTWYLSRGNTTPISTQVLWHISWTIIDGTNFICKTFIDRV